MVGFGPGSVQKRSLDQAAADALRKSIIEGGIPPGSRLTEVQVASQLGLSRGTIRAALQRLVAEGLVVQRPYSGWDVVKLSARDAWEVYILRSSLEGLAARLAARNPDRRHALVCAFESLKRTASAGTQKEIADADLHLHRTIVMLSGHGRLAVQYSMVEQQVRMFVASSNSILPRPDMVVRNHEDLVRSVLDGDEASAERHAREHTEAAGTLLVRYLEDCTFDESAA